MTDNEQPVPSGLAQGIAAALEQKKPWILASLARAFKVTEKDVAGVLPEEMCVFVSGEHFEEVWTALGVWERATVIVEHEGHVFEVRCRIPAGRPDRGYYHILGENVFGGHIRADTITDIAFLSMPFMGQESYSVQFFNTGGHVMFAVYAGREHHHIVPSVKTSFLAMRRKFAGA